MFIYDLLNLWHCHRPQLHFESNANEKIVIVSMLSLTFRSMQHCAQTQPRRAAGMAADSRSIYKTGERFVI